MKFSAALLVVAAYSVGQATAGASITRQYNAPANKAALHDCLNSYRTGNWDGKDCGVCTAKKTSV
jgi:hypothetical protein